MTRWPQHFMILIHGSTGVGKSAFALELGNSLPIEIVNADMGQLYKPLTIGTAKPSWQKEVIPHHLFDLIDEPRDYTVVAYRAAALATMHEIWQRGNIPVLVGGSGFYLHALLFPPQAAANVLKEKEGDASWELLASIDPERARAIHPHDTYRIARAITLWRTTGIKPSCLQRHYDPPVPFLLLNLERERDELYALIDERTKVMIKAGWQEECTALVGTAWEPFLKRKKLIGYSELFSFLSGDCSLDEAIDNIQRKTRRYAKRQQTFWKMFERQVKTVIENRSVMPALVKTINLTLTEPRLYINQLIEDIEIFCK